MSDSLNRQAPVGRTRSALALIGFLTACFAVAGLGSVITTPQTIPGGWYGTLDKPFFSPPSWLFGPVWSILYFLIAVSGWLVWRQRGFSGARVAMLLFFGQLTLNFVWSAIFFGLQAPGLALVEILILWGAILLTALVFRPLSRLAAVLLLPYLAWVTFAAVLNAAIWWLN
jgi:translocator protein